MSKKIEPFKCTQPCSNCPYRTDAPLKLWHKSEYEKLLKTENEKLRDSIMTSFPMYTPMPMPPIPYPYSKTIFITRKQFLNYKFRTGDWATIEPIDIDYKRSKVLKMELHSYTPFPEQQIILTFVPKKNKP